MISLKKFLFLFVTTIFIAALLHPGNIQAEIATVRDWIGLFAAGSSGDGTNDTVGGNSWKYTSSCLQTPGTTPKLSADSTCSSFTAPSTPGAYELRLYANNVGVSPSPGAPEAKIAQSKVFWIPFNISGSTPTPCRVTTDTQSRRTLTTTINWPTLAGTPGIILKRSGPDGNQSFNVCSAGVCPNTYTDTITSAGANNTLYIYSLTASKGGTSWNSSNSLQVRITGDDSCSVVSYIKAQPAAPASTPTPTAGPNVDCPNSRVPDDARRIDIKNGFLTTVDFNPSANSKYSLDPTTPAAPKCLLGQRAYISDAAISSYSYKNLRLNYYDNTKLPSGPNNEFVDGTTSTLTSTLSGNGNNMDGKNYYLLHFKGNVTITPDSPLDIGPDQVAVVFIDGNLLIRNNISDNDSSGIIFVVGGDVRIETSVTQINAFIITYNHFCTTATWNGSTLNCSPNSTTAQQLVINGSVIFLNSPITMGPLPDKPAFTRTLDNNSDPAEKIVFQPKYLVLLRNIFASNLTNWSEIQ